MSFIQVRMGSKTLGLSFLLFPPSSCHPRAPHQGSSSKVFRCPWHSRTWNQLLKMCVLSLFCQQALGAHHVTPNHPCLAVPSMLMLTLITPHFLSHHPPSTPCLFLPTTIGNLSIVSSHRFLLLPPHIHQPSNCSKCQMNLAFISTSCIEQPSELSNRTGIMLSPKKLGVEPINLV